MARYYFLGECMISNCSTPLFTNHRAVELNSPVRVTADNHSIETYECFNNEFSVIKSAIANFGLVLKNIWFIKGRCKMLVELKLEEYSID